MDLRSLYTRELPQNLFTVGYSGVLSPSLFLEGRYSARHFSFIGSGATSTDIIDGTLLIDSARGNLRYWSPTFCGVCDPEKRDNEEVFVKGTYVLSTGGSGSHTMLFGYDTFNDKRFANNHQSGSDYRILGTTSIVRGADIYPRWLPGSTTIQWNPIAEGSQGTNFRTNALFFNDNWRWTDRVTVNLGLRWDKNQGKDSAGATVADDSAFSPRVGIVWDPTGKGLWAVTASFARYVAGLNNSIADSSSAAGNPATIQVHLPGARDQSGRERGGSGHARRRAPAALRLVQRQRRHEHDADGLVRAWRVGQDSELADVAERARVRRWLQPAADEPGGRAGGLLVSRLSRFLFGPDRSIHRHRRRPVRQQGPIWRSSRTPTI